MKFTFSFLFNYLSQNLSPLKSGLMGLFIYYRKHSAFNCLLKGSYTPLSFAAVLNRKAGAQPGRRRANPPPHLHPEMLGGWDPTMETNPFTQSPFLLVKTPLLSSLVRQYIRRLCWLVLTLPIFCCVVDIPSHSAADALSSWCRIHSYSHGAELFCPWLPFPRSLFFSLLACWKWSKLFPWGLPQLETRDTSELEAPKPCSSTLQWVRHWLHPSA